MSAIQNRDRNCRVCGEEKRIEIERGIFDRTGNRVGTSKTVEVPGSALEPGEHIARVFCSGCGLVYHENTVV